MIHVLSTGNKPALQNNIASVAKQTLPCLHHIYTDPKRSYAQNLFSLAYELDPKDIIACVDADDWLATPYALEQVAEAHAAGAWCTYGSYRFADGRPAPWQRAYGPEENVRSAPWQASHLKTFRAGLVQRLDHRTFDLEHGRDQALMLPILEMCGPDRAKFIPEVLYVYNWGSSFEFNATLEELAIEAEHVQAIRERPPYPRLEKL